MSLVVTRGYGRSKQNKLEPGPITLGYGRIEILRPTRVVEPGHIDSRPLLYPPTIGVEAIPVGIPTIVDFLDLYAPTVTFLPYIDIVEMVLGIVTETAQTLGIIQSAATLAYIQPNIEMLLQVEPEPEELVETDSIVEFRLGLAQEADMLATIKDTVEAKLEIDESFGVNLTQTLDY